MGELLPKYSVFEESGVLSMVPLPSPRERVMRSSSRQSLVSGDSCSTCSRKAEKEKGKNVSIRCSQIVRAFFIVLGEMGRINSVYIRNCSHLRDADDRRLSLYILLSLPPIEDNFNV